MIIEGFVYLAPEGTAKRTSGEINHDRRIAFAGIQNDIVRPMKYMLLFAGALRKHDSKKYSTSRCRRESKCVPDSRKYDPCDHLAPHRRIKRTTLRKLVQ